MDSLNIILERSKKQYTQAEKDELAAVKNSRYVELLQNLTPNDVLPGMRCFLKSCHDRGLKTALASASKNMPQFLHRLVWIFQFWELSIKTVPSGDSLCIFCYGNTGHIPRTQYRPATNTCCAAGESQCLCLGSNSIGCGIQCSRIGRNGIPCLPNHAVGSRNPAASIKL